MMATTFSEAKIRVNCIAPGIFPSEMTAGSSGDDQKSTLEMEMSNPAGKESCDRLTINQAEETLTLAKVVLAMTLIWRLVYCSSPGLAAYSSTRKFSIQMEVNC